MICEARHGLSSYSLEMTGKRTESDLQSDTIIAPATAAGESGVSILRMSGPRAAQTLRQWFIPRRSRCRWARHRLYFGDIRDPRSGDLIDQRLAVLMRAPRTYTGEDVAEVHCHGSPAVVQEVLELAREAGVRLAYPGEFTLRAYPARFLMKSKRYGVSWSARRRFWKRQSTFRRTRYLLKTSAAH